VRLGEMVKAAAREQLPVVHPENPDIEGITIIVVSGPPTHPDATLKNAALARRTPNPDIACSLNPIDL
jgi:proline racemase